MDCVSVWIRFSSTNGTAFLGLSLTGFKPGGGFDAHREVAACVAGVWPVLIR